MGRIGNPSLSDIDQTDCVESVINLLTKGNPI